jgi:hypothetical protein
MTGGQNEDDVDGDDDNNNNNDNNYYNYKHNNNAHTRINHDRPHNNNKRHGTTTAVNCDENPWLIIWNYQLRPRGLYLKHNYMQEPLY